MTGRPKIKPLGGRQYAVVVVDRKGRELRRSRQTDLPGAHVMIANYRRIGAFEKA